MSNKLPGDAHAAWDRTLRTTALNQVFCLPQNDHTSNPFPIPWHLSVQNLILNWKKKNFLVFGLKSSDFPQPISYEGGRWGDPSINPIQMFLF